MFMLKRPVFVFRKRANLKIFDFNFVLLEIQKFVKKIISVFCRKRFFRQHEQTK